MKSASRLFLALIMTLIFAGVSLAQGTPAPAKPAAPEKMEKKAAPEKMEKAEKKEKAKTSTITGEVASVDPKAGTLTVKAKDKDVNLTAESKSAKSALEKVKTGDMVKVSYAEKDGKNVATSIAKAKGEAKGKDTSMEKKAEPKAMEKKEESKAKTK